MPSGLSLSPLTIYLLSTKAKSVYYQRTKSYPRRAPDEDHIRNFVQVTDRNGVTFNSTEVPAAVPCRCSSDWTLLSRVAGEPWTWWPRPGLLCRLRSPPFKFFFSRTFRSYSYRCVETFRSIHFLEFCSLCVCFVGVWHREEKIREEYWSGSALCPSKYLADCQCDLWFTSHVCQSVCLFS